MVREERIPEHPAQNGLQANPLHPTIVGFIACKDLQLLQFFFPERFGSLQPFIEACLRPVPLDIRSFRVNFVANPQDEHVSAFLARSQGTGFKGKSAHGFIPIEMGAFETLRRPPGNHGLRPIQYPAFSDKIQQHRVKAHRRRSISAAPRHSIDHLVWNVTRSSKERLGRTETPYSPHKIRCNNEVTCR
jgi:hypothetical protein